MATYTVTFHQRLDDYAVVQTLENVEISVGQSFTLAGLGHGLNGTHVCYAVPQYLFIGTDTEGDLLFDGNVAIPNQVMFYDVGDALERSSTLSTGTLTYTPTCTWITGSDIQEYLGIQTSVTDDLYLDQCAAAANNFCHRRRSEAGYFDSLSTSPGADVTLGTTMVGAAYFRQRASYSNIASFDQMGLTPGNGVSPMVMQLLGINRPQVA